MNNKTGSGTARNARNNIINNNIIYSGAIPLQEKLIRKDLQPIRY